MSQTVTKLPFLAIQPRSPGSLGQLWHRIATAWQDAATRRALAALDDRALSDIGISRAQAQFESEPPIWMHVPGIQR